MRVAQIDQMLSGELSAFDVVDCDAAPISPWATAVEQHERCAAVAELLLKLGCMPSRRSDQDSCDSLFFEKAQVLILKRAVAAGAAENHDVVDLVRSFLHTPSHLGKERIIDVQHNQSDRGTVHASKLPGSLVTDEAELFDRLVDACQRRVGDQVRPVEGI